MNKSKKGWGRSYGYKNGGDLSDKIKPLFLDKRGFKILDYIEVKDVKEFIKALKEECYKRKLDCVLSDEEHTILWVIDNLAGEEFVK